MCLLAAYRPAPALAQVQGRIAIPADDFALDADSVGDASAKLTALRSQGGQLAHRLQLAIQSGAVPLTGSPTDGQHGQDGGSSGDGGDAKNTQINNPALDHTVTFAGTRPFEFSTQSETSATAFGKHIVVGYNSSAASVVQRIGTGLFLTQALFSAYSVSHDGGQTWTSGFVPPAAAATSPFTFGDPALALDRNGNVYYASLGTDAAGNSALIVNKSSDHGDTFGTAKVAAVDPGADKDWLAVGPDPAVPQRDNIYVTWTSFQTDAKGNTIGSQLMLARSIDGGATWSSKVVFAPVDDGINSSFLSFSNPVVDASNGRLYIPFLHISDIDADNVRVLASNDGGQTFTFLAFHVAGAPDAFAFPVVTPGAINDCGGGGFRNVLHQGTSLGAGRIPGTFRYVQSTRLITQPAAAASRGRLLIALQSSTSPFFGDPASGSEIKLLYSQDGGASWATPLSIAASTAANPQHVHPAIALDSKEDQAWITYYVQQADGRLRTDVTRVEIDDNNRLKLDDTSGLSTQAFDLTPNNIPTTIPSNPARTTNYDRIIATCYDIGEYMSVAVSAASDGDSGRPIAAWGDNRNSWTGPAATPLSPASAAPFTHAQPDVFSARVGNQ
ncbi:MAG TPA: sialidase family protein [Candidatus Acidoferrales bacterium]|nr:sialidase family protein [Candidatus Acidoferrales bacterium]